MPGLLLLLVLMAGDLVCISQSTNLPPRLQLETVRAAFANGIRPAPVFHSTITDVAEEECVTSHSAPASSCLRGE